VYAFHGPIAQTIKLVAYNSLNCSAKTEREITLGPRPAADFLPNLEQNCIKPSLSGCGPFTPNLINTSMSVSDYTSYWDFGDGATSDINSPVHTYQKGNFVLTLTIRTNEGCTSKVSRNVAVSDVKPAAKFTFDKANVCVKEIVTFSDQSTNASFWCWDFGDGNNGSGKSAIHGYAKPGIYTVTLTAKNAGCTDSFQIVNAIIVKDPYIDFNALRTCADPFTINFQNLSTNYQSLQWDFGDGTIINSDVTSHHYSAVGDYTIRLTGSNATTGCTVTASVPVKVRQVNADFIIDNSKPCKGAPIGFTDRSTSAVSWDWVFGNTLSSIDQNPSTTYTAGGNYNIKLVVTGSDGFQDSKTLPVEVLGIVGNFSFDATSSCNALKVNFKDQTVSTPPITAWKWDFGDGQTSTDANPVHVYNIINNYPVTLTITNMQGTCTLLRRNAVKFTVPAPDFFLFKSEFCIGEIVAFSNNSINAKTYN